MRRSQCLIATVVLVLSSAQADMPPLEWRLFGPAIYFLDDAEGNTAGAELDTLTSPNAIDTPDNSFIFATSLGRLLQQYRGHRGF